MHSRRPFSTAGKKPLGTEPPTTRSPNSNPSLSQEKTQSTHHRTGRGRRSASYAALAPAPFADGLPIGNLWFFSVISTPNFALSLETATSRCCSPSPLSTISWVSWIGGKFQSGILLGETEHALGHFILFPLFWAQWPWKGWDWGTYAVKHHLVRRGTKSIACIGGSELRNGTDIPSADIFHILLLLPHIITVLPMRSVFPVRMLTSWDSVEIFPEITFT